jgi:hypothetical protein
MTHPLDGPRLRITRATNQIGTLRLADEHFRSKSNYRVVVAELNAEATDYALRALVDVLPPTDLGVCIGEIAHNLRSALDGLVYQLAILNKATEKALTGTQFPIFLLDRAVECKGQPEKAGHCSNSAHFFCRGLRQIAALDSKHQARIERLQPYHLANGGQESALYLLHEINNADKHRLLQAIGGKAAGYMIGGVWGDPDTPAPDYEIWPRAVFEDDAKVGRTAATDVQTHRVQIDQGIIPYISFWQGCEPVKGLGVTYTLGRIAKKVSEIVENFRPEFG